MRTTTATELAKGARQVPQLESTCLAAANRKALSTKTAQLESTPMRAATVCPHARRAKRAEAGGILLAAKDMVPSIKLLKWTVVFMCDM